MRTRRRAVSGKALERFLPWKATPRTAAPGPSRPRPDKNPEPVTPSPAPLTTTATPAIGMPSHSTSEYLRGGCTLNITAPQPCPFHCTEIPSGACFPCTNITNVRAPSAGPEELAVLKQRLQDALVEIEVQERTLEERMRPRSVAEAEALERSLERGPRQSCESRRMSCNI